MATPLDPQYIDQIKGFEGYSPNAAWDYKQSSSGYGTRAQPGDENLPPDQLKAIHEQRFTDEISKAASAVDAVNPNLPPGARAALISLTYNAGPGWAQSGLGDLVRSGDLQGAQQRLLEYNKAGGEVNPGLVKRRTAESAWFNGQAAPAPQQTAQASPAAPAMGLPQQRPPIFPQQAQAAPQQQAPPQGQGGSFSGQMPAEQPMQAPPIFYAPRKAPSIQALQQALQASGNRGPFFGRG
jgi:lysozyme